MAHLTYQSGRGSQVLPAPLRPYLWEVRLAYPAPYPKLLQPGNRAALPYIIWPFSLPGLCVHPLHSRPLGPAGSALPALPFFTWPGSVWSRSFGILPDAPASSYTLLFTYNKCSPPLYLGPVTSFPFLFLFISCCIHLVPKPRIKTGFFHSLLLCGSYHNPSLRSFHLTTVY